MKTILFLTFTLCLVNTFKVAQFLTKTEASSPSQLGFSNYTGSDVTPDQVKTIVNLINGASGFYKDDVQKNLAYIKDNLQKQFPEEGTTFFVFIQTLKTTRISESFWKPMQFIVSFAAGVSVVNPGWSYYIYKIYLPSNTFKSGWAYLHEQQKSSKLSQEDIKFIQTTIFKEEPDYFVCHCDYASLQRITDAVSNHFGQLWNVLCDDSGSTSAIVNALNGHWGAGFKGKNYCSYTMFEYFAFC